MNNKEKHLDYFNKYLSVWITICITIGIIIGHLLDTRIQFLSKLEIYNVNIPVTFLIWLMIYPMMLQIDFSSVRKVSRQPKGLILTVVVNWFIKPFSMAFFAWLFLSKIYGAIISPDQAGEYISGAILLGAAPCTATVFLWSYLTDGDPNYTLIQVSINDLIILIAYVPIVGLLLDAAKIQIPYGTLAASIVSFVVIPFSVGYVSRIVLIRSKGEDWFKESFLPKFKPLSKFALLVTLVLLFAFQGQNILQNPLIIALVAVPLVIQTYFIFFITWFGGRKIKLPHAICSPAAMIGASNFFELAVAVAISLFGLHSPAAMVTVVGVLVEVPVMLSLVSLSNKWRY